MGTHKGLLEAPGSRLPILEHLVSLGRDAALPVVLVGDATPYDRLAEGVPRIADEPRGAGPLAGLHAALRYALRCRRTHVIAVACDMPFVSSEALNELVVHRSEAPVLAPRRRSEGPWEPMLARYDAAALVDAVGAAIADGQRSFQQLFGTLEVEPLHLSAAVDRGLRDWDTPGDVGA
jgi:molybdopterin-guanine dinucleotide biosynthesis protein A